MSIFAFFASSLPFLWNVLHDYQKRRILTLFNPEKDPLGSGYHIIQSKIAIGSGGVLGKGFLNGTQGSLDFLPEKHTDFIFTLLNEEFGFLGGFALIVLYIFLTFFNVSLAFQVRDDFCRFVILGLALSFVCYALINIGMVVGVLPVVGIPLPLVSYGGTSVVTLLISQGLIFSAVLSKTKTTQLQFLLKNP
jgi:rod shape determining protein RodA